VEFAFHWVSVKRAPPSRPLASGLTFRPLMRPVHAVM
jgi:hypothetical protein